MLQIRYRYLITKITLIYKYFRNTNRSRKRKYLFNRRIFLIQSSLSPAQRQLNHLSYNNFISTTLTSRRHRDYLFNQIISFRKFARVVHARIKLTRVNNPIGYLEEI